MAYDTTGADEGSTSRFNAGILQMQRIHNLQDKINFCWLNPLAWNQEFAVWNYEVVFSCTNSLFQEVCSKLGTKEIEAGGKFRELIQDFIKIHPVYQSVKIPTYPYKSPPRLNKKNWEMIKEILFKYETMVRGFLDKHGMSSPDDDEGVWD